MACLGVVEHVEIGIDAPDFPAALRGVPRQAPDVTMVGEMRDPETMPLAGVLVQTLIPKIGGGLIPTAELLIVGCGARQHVRNNALHHLHQEITITRKPGSFTLEESLTELVKQGLVDRKDALARAGHAEELERLLGA